MLKLAQLGACCTEYDRALPAESLAVGWKLYLLPAVTEVGGVPEIVTVAGDGLPPEATTFTANAVVLAH